MNQSINKINTFILAGGLSSRMGEEKGLIKWKHKTFVEHIIDAVSALNTEIHIISNDTKYHHLGYPVYLDLVKDSGPLAGIYTGLHYSDTDRNLFVSCDTPRIESNLLMELIKNSHSFDVTCPVIDNKIHPLIGVYSKKCVPFFKKRIENRELGVIRSLDDINLNSMPIIPTRVPNASEQVSNINTSQDLVELYGN